MASFAVRRHRLAAARAAPRPAHGFRSDWTVVDGLRLHSRRPEDGARRSGPPVVLVHGLAVSHRYLMPTAERLAPRHDVRVLDLPGFGLSEHPPRPLGTTEHADAIGAWLDAVALGPAVLLGNSYGCQVLVDLVARQPHRCTALVLSGPTVDPRARTATRQVLRWLRDAVREDPLQLLVLRRDIADAGPRRVWATLQAALRDRIETKLPAVQVPTLVLRGQVEPIVPHRWAREITSLAPRAELAVVPGSAHNAVYVAPEALVTRIESFLRRHADPE